MEWHQLSKQDRKDIFEQSAIKLNLPPAAIEKDWWVTEMLHALFTSAYKDYLVFKGGTSLSKCYQLIERFSEDLDMALNPEAIGLTYPTTKTQIVKLRKASFKFISTQLLNTLKEYFNKNTYPEFIDITAKPDTEGSQSDRDPQVLYLEYESLVDTSSYLKDKVILEVSIRSQTEPANYCEVSSLTYSQYSNLEVLRKPFTINAISPKRTLLEKLILLHEEFQKPEADIRVSRMSRHLYDVYQLLNDAETRTALTDNALFTMICNHRKLFTPMKHTNYESLTIHNLQVIPPLSVFNSYQSDYKQMQESMFYIKTLTFNKLINEINKILIQ